MAKEHPHKKHQHKVLVIVLVAVVFFSLGYILARAKYKSQLKTTYSIVMQKDAEISSLNSKVIQIQNILKNKTSN